jgi:hypothetical protein
LLFGFRLSRGAAMLLSTGVRQVWIYDRDEFKGILLSKRQLFENEEKR